jgi:hypothetical protein
MQLHDYLAKSIGLVGVISLQGCSPVIEGRQTPLPTGILMQGGFGRKGKL